MFTANAAWLVLACIAFNRASAAGTLGSPALGKAVTATVRRTLIKRRLESVHLRTPHHPAPAKHWPWEHCWTTLFTHVCSPPGRATT